MAYTKTTWLDRVVQFPKRYTKSGETSTSVTLDADPGTVTNAGTPINATNLNKIEQGIEDAHTALGGLQFRDTSGYVEYNDGSGWQAVGGSGMYVSSTTQQYSDATERTNSTSRYVLVHKFIPLFTGEIKVTADLRASGIGTGSDARLILVTPSKSSSGDPVPLLGGDDVGGGNTLINYETPVGTLIGVSLAQYDYANFHAIHNSSTTYATKTAVINVVNKMPIYFLLNGNADAGLTSDNCQIKNFKISYDIIRGG